MKAGVALNPHSPVHLLEDIIADIDLICLMGVNPGFGGQKFIENTYAKVSTLKKLIIEKKSKALIEIDGGVDFENYKKRVTKEKDDLRVNTKTMMLTAILDLDSDLSIAVKASKDPDGLRLIMSKLDKFLSNQGVESIQTETYDTDLHEVISVLEIGEEKIIDVVSKGYSINGKPFRFPKIILGK
jgi:molecular chaperone GrpE (heat shock protein)